MPVETKRSSYSANRSGTERVFSLALRDLIGFMSRTRFACLLIAERVHADDTTVPELTKLKIVLGRIWTYVRDGRPFCGQDPPAAAFDGSRSRAGEGPKIYAGYASDECRLV
jgi:hypothetical protein